MIILLTIVFVQSLNLLIFTWLYQSAWIRILALRQQINIYKRRVNRPQLRNRDRLFWSVLSGVWREWTSELILVRAETVFRWRKSVSRQQTAGKWDKTISNTPPSILVTLCNSMTMSRTVHCILDISIILSYFLTVFLISFPHTRRRSVFSAQLCWPK
jgi:hypothetical protein